MRGHHSHTAPVDRHHDRLRFSWELAMQNVPAVVVGTDFGIVAADGQLQTVTGFLDTTSSGEVA
jgi:hypothetical protein